MGLSITAYSKIQRVEPQPASQEKAEACYFVHLRVNPDFPGRANEIQTGYHAFTESYYFGAGSYVGYGAWRDELAQLAGYEPVPGMRFPYSHGAWRSKEGPFRELIAFADHEGVIGAEVSAKLLRDFVQFHERATMCTDFFLQQYEYWQRAFMLAMDHGAVKFH